jgi:phosphopantothenoylcysteine decarboxylase/phosphopantothenate--cysteine ligase
MNREMWDHPATQRNLTQLRLDGTQVLGVNIGAQACGEVGAGRMLEADELLSETIATLTPKRLHGKQVLITAGPTYEAMDPVRGITNLSSGKMGFAIAQAAYHAGAKVHLVTGPVALKTPYGVKRHDVVSTMSMLSIVESLIDQADIFIATAAVADWRVKNVATTKIKKEHQNRTPMAGLSWVENPDILSQIAHSPRAKNHQLYCVGFAAESEDLLTNTQQKRLRKQVPLLIGNIGPKTFGQDHNTLLLVDEEGTKELPYAPKQELAMQLIEEIGRRIN